MDACVGERDSPSCSGEQLAVRSPCWVITSIVYVPFGSIALIVWPPDWPREYPSLRAFERDRDRSRLNIRKGDFHRVAAVEEQVRVPPETYRRLRV